MISFAESCLLTPNILVQVHSWPAVFTALAVLERLGHRQEEEGGDGGVVLDRLARALLAVDKVSGELGFWIRILPQSLSSTPPAQASRCW